MPFMVLVDQETLDRMFVPAVLLVSVTALALVFIAQFVFGLKPCQLCLYQRIPYGATAGLALWVLILSGAGQAPVAVITGLIFCAGAVLAGYHVGIEQHWWQAATVCGSGEFNVETLMRADNLRAALFAERPVPCDAVAWSLFGLSMAAYNAVASFCLALCCFAFARMTMKAQTHESR